ncbi:uncharacterized protein LOC132637729 [Lycium barbarum]|uniref:uncharacterized protein LOC132637729 n=1 Tax=Lycium barbarum TaxID=112863 RepID=UPI00293F3FDF|nr:uncharacterized protein LOC132637729 [Lycium barbarum]
MGNCMKKESSMQWGGEDWSLPSTVPKTNKDFYCHKTMKVEEDHLHIGEEKENFNSSTSMIKEVIKIKITKKQLSELMGKADVEGLSVHQLLTKLMNVNEGIELHHRSWRPALQSIPEVN